MATLQTTHIKTAADTAGITLPSGTTAQRPTPAEGMMRYNSTEGYAEVFVNNGWQDIRKGTGETLVYYPLFGTGDGDITDTISGAVGQLGNTYQRNYTQSGYDGLYMSSGGYLDMFGTHTLQALSGNPFWTIEWWAYNFGNSGAGSASTMLEFNAYQGGILYRGQSTSVDHYWRGSGITWGSVDTGSWVHYAIVGTGTNIRIFNNGVLRADTMNGVGEARFSDPFPSQSYLRVPRLGASNHTSATGQYANAVYRKFRVSTIMRYYSAFTPADVYPL